MDGLASITDERKIKKHRLSLDSIVSHGPFDVAEKLSSLSQSELAMFYDSLREPDNQAMLAQLMYFQRYLHKVNPAISRDIEAIAIENHHRHIATGSPVPFALARFSEEEREVIFPHLAYLQVTQGCGGDCVNGCGVDAVPKIRDRIPCRHVSYVLEGVAGFKDRKHALKLFYASDPLEIVGIPDEFFLITDAYNRLFDKLFEVVTSIPRGTEELYKEICRRRKKDIHLCVSLTEQNVQRLYEHGITNVKDFNALTLNSGTNSWIPPGNFSPEYTPDHVNKIDEVYRDNVGINRYKLDGRKFNFWNRVALIMTPYGVLNTVCIPTVNRTFPQGRIVVSLGRLSDEAIESYSQEIIQPLLTRNVVRYSDSSDSPNRIVFTTNHSSNARILVNEHGKVLLIEKLYRDPGFLNARLG